MVGLGLLQNLVVMALAVLAFGLEVYALVDAARTRQDAFVAAGKQTKTLWLTVLGVGAALGFIALPPYNILPIYTLLPIAAVVAAAVYLTDVRPAVRQIRGGGGSGRNAGPYGPW
ncbi:MAG TPA: DUF2516 family protein [Kineosporiaceae bacterium]